MATRGISLLTGVGLLLSLIILAQFRIGLPALQAASAPAVHKTVKITETNNAYGFHPPKLTVKAGTKVTWSNKTDAPHTVTGTGSWKFSSHTFSQNHSVSFTFKKAGTFHYMCKIHPYMKGTITVTM